MKPIILKKKYLVSFSEFLADEYNERGNSTHEQKRTNHSSKFWISVRMSFIDLQVCFHRRSNMIFIVETKNFR